MSEWILVVGYGSIGRRHTRNLRQLGYEDVRLLRRADRRAAGFETPKGIPEYHHLDAALSDGPRVVIVANPTALHAETAMAAVDSGACVLLEKPVCADVDDARDLLAKAQVVGGVVSMAYCFRYHPLYRTLAEWAREGRVGRIFHINAWQASYLPDWHPWEEYRDGYAARAELGGGVVRTLDHDLDLIRWIAGEPAEVLASTGALSGLDVEVEDTADMIFRFADRLQASVHVCFGRRGYSRGMWIAGDRATASLDWNRGLVTLSDNRQVIEEAALPRDYDLNEMYVAMLADALEHFLQDSPSAAIPLEDGVAALVMGTAALESSSTSRAVPLDWRADILDSRTANLEEAPS